MAYRQPRVPEYREQDGPGKYIRTLVLFLKEFTTAAWKANNQRIREVEELREKLDEQTTGAAAQQERIRRLEEELNALREQI